ncbi:MAG: hypothetical protein C5B50_02595 [Verrucomicrobia bacterium]|nr:MAG: hypothetical protein C5B50_02595 [Verrucomicrobiota bacterium]
MRRIPPLSFSHSLDDFQYLSYHFGMRETITFRPSRPKSQIQDAFGNISEKLNELIEHELASGGPPDWRDVLKRAAPVADANAYELCLRPE